MTLLSSDSSCCHVWNTDYLLLQLLPLILIVLFILLLWIWFV